MFLSLIPLGPQKRPFSTFTYFRSMLTHAQYTTGNIKVVESSPLVKLLTSFFNCWCFEVINSHIVVHFEIFSSSVVSFMDCKVENVDLPKPRSLSYVFAMLSKRSLTACPEELDSVRQNVSSTRLEKFSPESLSDNSLTSRTLSSSFLWFLQILRKFGGTFNKDPFSERRNFGSVEAFRESSSAISESFLGANEDDSFFSWTFDVLEEFWDWFRAVSFVSLSGCPARGTSDVLHNDGGFLVPVI